MEFIEKMSTTPINATVAGSIVLLQIYGIYQFSSIRHLLVIQKRYPSIVLIESTALIACFIIGISGLALREYAVDPHSLFLLAIQIPVFMLIHFIVDVEALRLWLMWYDMNYIASSKNEKWKSQIDSAFAEKDWFLRNKHRWGNQSFVLKRGSLWYFPAASFVTAIICVHEFERYHEDYRFYWYLPDTVVFVFPVLLILFTYWKLPETNDGLFFQFEFKTTAITMFISVMIFILCFGVLEPIAITQNLPAIRYLSSALILIVTVISSAVPSLLSTIIIPMRVQKSSVWVRTI